MKRGFSIEKLIKGCFIQLGIMLKRVAHMGLCKWKPSNVNKLKSSVFCMFTFENNVNITYLCMVKGKWIGT